LAYSVGTSDAHILTGFVEFCVIGEMKQTLALLFYNKVSFLVTLVLSSAAVLTTLSCNNGHKTRQAEKRVG
jgi:hypothetical protein